MRKFFRILLRILIIIIVTDLALTIIAGADGKKYSSQFGQQQSRSKVLIVYDPDPFYSLDRQVCEGFAKTLASNGWFAQVVSVAAAKQINTSSYDLYVFCANTYNWSPDWAVTGFIEKDAGIKNKNVVAITLGAGSTKRSQKVFENIIKNTGANLIGSKTYWLWRPNDQSRTKESNVKVAIDMAEQYADQIGHQISVH